MNKLNPSFQLLANYDPRNISDLIRAITNQVNALAEGRIQARYNAQSAQPTSGIFQIGDFIPDSSAVERGSVAAGIAAKYVRLGWQCVTAGTAGGSAAFVECRALTGN